MYAPVPSIPLRSAMKHPSRPGTPLAGTPPVSPYNFTTALPSTSSTGIPVPYTHTHSSQSQHSTIASGSPSEHLSPYSTQSQSPTASTIHAPHALSQGYTPKVSFDTFENPAASMFSFTLSVKSDGYVRNRHTRVFLCAASADDSGRQALDWAIEDLVQDGDELVVFRGIDQEDLDKDHDIVREEARELLLRIQQKAMDLDHNRKLSIIVEFIAGKVTTTIDRLIALYRPDSVVVGTRGTRGMKAWGAAFGAPGMGSVSKYCLSHSPVPIIVVRPESKVRKAMEKRKADPKRGKHFDDGTRLTATRSNIPSVPMMSSVTR
ncbi:uncharacterized protein STEHIDRAFT_156110 [Stereum hirsutum FP-91666 SS1]|uniref:uncharacterized protein n=1 Tax=Stereum hirsutum (strain FP-91666) TaxID=721885 RepID=UPI000440A3CE|nr:uncharacterized protein STEHIDRAFT_156110 [Stereum hirsutum FP-91666 SS1]EIM87119.1 hypothetical protein STEHIDRAFT_156110 [Stereum hirsutum FP-91666 SS1]